MSPPAINFPRELPSPFIVTLGLSSSWWDRRSRKLPPWTAEPPNCRNFQIRDFLPTSPIVSPLPRAQIDSQAPTSAIPPMTRWMYLERVNMALLIYVQDAFGVYIQTLRWAKLGRLLDVVHRFGWGSEHSCSGPVSRPVVVNTMAISTFKC